MFGSYPMTAPTDPFAAGREAAARRRAYAVRLAHHRPVQFFLDAALEFEFELEVGEIALEIREV
jgi:hypothetical protein